ncbi:MAG: biopolymer transporter ExbD [Candidatus Competibacteraceae bacterium]
MNLHPRRREEPEINLISLVDVLLTVLLFFIVTTTFRKESDFRIDLPEASVQGTASAQQVELDVTIDAQGRYFLNDRALADTSPATLRDAIGQRAGERRDQIVIIRADAKTPYQAVITAMDVIGRLGFKHLAIPTVQAPPGDDEPQAQESQATP